MVPLNGMRGKGKGERGSSIYQRLPSHQCNKSKLKLHEREGEGVVSFPGRFVGGGKRFPPPTNRPGNEAREGGERV